MDGRTAAFRIVEVAVLVAVLSLVLGQLSGQPILLSYVETGSMSPALEAGDGFIAVPAAVAGPVERGDVIVFRAERLNGGGLVTHRVVETTAEGDYVTRGDANPFTDQDGVEPPVQDAQVVAKALQLGGTVVAIPYLGVGVLAVAGALSNLQGWLAGVFRTRALLGTQGLAYLLFGLGLLAYLASWIAESGRSRRRGRRRRQDDGVMDARLVVASLTLLLMAITTGAMVVPGGTHAFEVISSDTDAPGPRVIPSGETEAVEFIVPSNGVFPVVVFLEPRGSGIDVSPRELAVPGNSNRTATVHLTAPRDTGRYVRYLTEHRYLAVMPHGTIRTLYGVHPWLPILAIDALIGAGFAGLGTAMLGTGRIRMRPTRQLPLRARIERWFR